MPTPKELGELASSTEWGQDIVDSVLSFGKPVVMFPLTKDPIIIALGVFSIRIKPTRISRKASRRIERLRAIQRDGNINQDFGRDTYEYNIEGEIYGDDRSLGHAILGSMINVFGKVSAQSKRYVLEYCFHDRIPLAISSAIDTTVCNITSLEFYQVGSKPNVLGYNMTLLEISEVDAKTRLIRGVLGSVVGTLTSTTLKGLGAIAGSISA